MPSWLGVSHISSPAVLFYLVSLFSIRASIGGECSICIEWYAAEATYSVAGKTVMDALLNEQAMEY